MTSELYFLARTETALSEAEKKQDGRDWARRVLKRNAAGEYLPLIALEYAREVLAGRSREPGEDDV